MNADSLITDPNQIQARQTLNMPTAEQSKAAPPTEDSIDASGPPVQIQPATGAHVHYCIVFLNTYFLSDSSTPLQMDRC
jgi:hypothetical protein